MRRVSLPVRQEQQALLLAADEVHPTGKQALDLLRTRTQSCKRCTRHQDRKTVLQGTGRTERPLLAIVTDTPTAVHEREGRWFVGRDASMLQRALHRLGLAESDVYITGAVLCASKLQYVLTEGEIRACGGYLAQQMLAVRPHVILAMGNDAIRALCGGEGFALTVRGQWREYAGIPVMPTVHFSTLMHPSLTDATYYKERTWEDIVRAYDRAVLEQRKFAAE